MGHVPLHPPDVGHALYEKLDAQPFHFAEAMEYLCKRIGEWGAVVETLR